MAVLVSDLVTTLDKYIRDTSTDSVSAAERYDALTEATVWLIERTTNEHAVRTYTLNYVDTVHTYRVDSSIADLLEPGDLRRAEDDQTMPATRKSSREMAEDIANESPEFAFAIERKDGKAYAVINLQGNEVAQQICSFDSLTADGGTWAADATNGDALNLSADTIEYKSGSGSLNFDIDVSQTGNNTAIISSTITSVDLTDYNSVGRFVLDVYIPDETYTSSFTLYWGSDSSNYWSVTPTTDASGNAFASGWNKVAFSWEDATATGSPVITAIDYIRIDLNYAGGQGDDTDYRYDNLVIAKPEKLVFHYLSQRVGTNNAGTTIYKFGATNDVAYFSGQHDHYKFPVAHKAAAILFRTLGLKEDAVMEETEAEKGLVQKQKLFASVHSPEDRSFKVKQISFKRRKF